MTVPNTPFSESGQILYLIKIVKCKKVYNEKLFNEYPFLHDHFVKSNKENNLKSWNYYATHSSEFKLFPSYWWQVKETNCCVSFQQIRSIKILLENGKEF